MWVSAGRVEVRSLPWLLMADRAEDPTTALEARLASLELDKLTWEAADRERSRLSDALGERIKELTCLYGLSQIIEREGESIDRVMQAAVELLPGSWQYPSSACARIEWLGREYLTERFRPSEWCLHADIRSAGEVVGSVAVHYLEERPPSDEGPFLAEERLLIMAVAEQLGRAIGTMRLRGYLRERVKELTCLYGISELIDTRGTDTGAIVQGIADLLPESWQYPEVTSARIILGEEGYATRGFRQSQWRQEAPILFRGQELGSVEVCYSREMPEADEGPFLEEERLLITAIADRIGKVISRIRAEKQLVIERTTIENKNVALAEILDRVQQEKEEIGGRVQANVDRIITPIINALLEQTSGSSRGYVELLKKSLEEITEPFAHAVARDFAALTPTEIQVCGMIRTGLSSKEIARLRQISLSTVSRHREGIRRKLGLTSSPINLASFLSSRME